MYELSIFRKIRPLDPDAPKEPCWQIRDESGKLVAAAPIDNAYTVELDGVLVEIKFSKSRWLRTSKGTELSPSLTPAEVMQPGKDELIRVIQLEDLDYYSSQYWHSTSVPLFQSISKTDVQSEPGGSLTTSRLE